MKHAFITAISLFFASCIGCGISLPALSFTTTDAYVINGFSSDFSSYDQVDIPLSDFTSIRNSTPFDLYFSQSDEYSVRLEGDEKFFNIITATVAKGELAFEIKSGRYHNVKLRIIVSSPEINALTVKKSGSVFCQTPIASRGNMNLGISGSGDLTAEYGITCRNLDISVHGSGDMKVGNVKSDATDVQIHGSGDIVVGGIESRELSASISGSGDISMSGIKSETTTLTIAGSGDIHVNGETDKVTAKTNGSGDISGNLKRNTADTHRNGSGHISF